MVQSPTLRFTAFLHSPSFSFPPLTDPVLLFFGALQILLLHARRVVLNRVTLCMCTPLDCALLTQS
jgi:hypothetical protein